MLVGREAELAALADLVERAVGHRGGVLVLRGAPGAGRSALLAETAKLARQRGLRVLTARGHQAETDVPLAGLHGLMVSARVGGTSPRAGEAILAAVGRGGQDGVRVVDRLLTRLSAGGRGALLAIDDSQWLDEPSWDALLQGCRAADQGVAAVLAVRDGPATTRRLAGADLPTLAVGALPRRAAQRVLERVAPSLAIGLRDRVLEQAHGNPLALVELGAAAQRLDEAEPWPETIPVSAQVEHAVGALVATMPPVTVSALRVAAFDDVDDLLEILAATTVLTGEPAAAAALRPAQEAGLVLARDGRLRFRQPLLRAALRRGVTPAGRLEIHGAIAEAVVDDPDRQTWHRAAAAPGPDEELAGELATIAAAATARGDNRTAARALRRAAELSASPAARNSRLLSAAVRFAAVGSRAAVVRLLDQVSERQLPANERARLEWERENHIGGGWTGAARMAALATAADMVRADGDSALALEMLQSAAFRLFWSNVDEATRAAVLAVADRLEVPPGDTQMICLLARVAPIERGAVVLERLRRVPVADSPGEARLLGVAASAVGAFDVATSLLRSSTVQLRRLGNLGLVVRSQGAQAWVAAQLADTRLALAAATECETLAGQTGHPMWASMARIAVGQVEALRGNSAAARALADAGERMFLPMGVHPVLAMVQLVRGIDALAHGMPGAAFDSLIAIYDPADIRFHRYVRLHALGLLAEAAVQSGQRDRLAELVDEFEPIARRSRSPALLLGLAYARAVQAPAAEAESLFETALAADLTGWPFERARLQLAYGAWLRRNRRPAASRPHLRAAGATFAGLGVVPWAERARRELAATGESVRRREDRANRLTPQEQEIAQLAAQGLSNRAIAERLVVSPRTVTTHLYRIYPKIGVSSRAELARALESSTVDRA
ncbi:MAG TPA: AAA family ATPase [Kofleriaceae bacterium]|nr:AAA family ATPase [Kofleriaceae bacterium]